MPINSGSSSSMKMKGVVVDEDVHDQGASSSSSAIRNNLTALIVDDNTVNRIVLKAHLTTLGVKAVEVMNGLEAVNICSSGLKFDLILIDMEMPIMDGLEATKRMRMMGIRSKIVGVSGNSRKSEIQAFMDAGIDEFWVKPMTREKLISLLEEINN
ncbi:two-component response regulator 24-like [Tasmannia lanceolata]|uniref:two-component response regulator 24-like n=1 Tax=Tasmannia lanceolata TaxID=3420 RepID=UPI0040632235